MGVQNEYLIKTTQKTTQKAVAYKINKMNKARGIYPER